MSTAHGAVTVNESLSDAHTQTQTRVAPTARVNGVTVSRRNLLKDSGSELLVSLKTAQHKIFLLILWYIYGFLTGAQSRKTLKSRMDRNQRWEWKTAISKDKKMDGAKDPEAKRDEVSFTRAQEDHQRRSMTVKPDPIQTSPSSYWLAFPWTLTFDIVWGLWPWL